MPQITSGSNATISVSVGQVLTVQSDQAEYTYENPVGTRVGQYGFDKAFGPFTSAGSVKLTSIQGPLYYELGTQSVGGDTTYDPSNVNIGGGTATLSSLNITGVAQFANGSAAAPSISFASDAATGIYKVGTSSVGISGAGFTWLATNTSGFGVRMAGALDLGFFGDCVLQRDAANTLAQRNGTAAQTFNLYNTYTDAANYNLFYARTIGTRAEIGTAQAGTGGVLPLRVSIAGTGAWDFQAGLHFVPVTDAITDIGSSGLRARHIFAAGDVTGTDFIAIGAAAATTAGKISYGATTQTTVGAAGAAAALPTAPLGYIQINVGGTAAKIPYYNN